MKYVNYHLSIEGVRMSKMVFERLRLVGPRSVNLPLRNFVAYLPGEQAGARSLQKELSENRNHFFCCCLQKHALKNEKPIGRKRFVVSISTNEWMTPLKS